MKKIVIGILPTYIKTSESPYDEYDKFIYLYAKKIKEAGGVPVGLLFDDDKIDEDILDLCDGFIIPGGNKVHKFVYETILYCIQKNKPLIGICLGAEAIDIFSCIFEEMKKQNNKDVISIYKELKDKNDGTLLMRLDEERLLIHNHDYLSDEDYDKCSHNILIERDSLVYSVLKSDELMVPSMHGYNFKHVGSDFKISAYSEDGVCEAIEYLDSDNFIIGFHFHPELMNTDIFKRLIEECQKRK